MSEEDARAQYEECKEFYVRLQGQVEIDVRACFKEHHLSVDVDGIISRHDSITKEPHIKEFSQVFSKAQDPTFTAITMIKDIAGIRIVCHCKSDQERAIALLLDFLEGRYRIIESEEENAENGYRAHHIVIANSSIGQDYMCEIQIRTVLQHAWSVQSHKYGYKKKSEGDSNILMQSMSGILDSCEKLWELVKEKNGNARKEIDAAAGQLSEDVSQSVAQIEHTAVARPLMTRDSITAKLRTFTDTDIIDLKDMVEREFTRLKRVWETQITSANPAVANGDAAFELMQKEMLDLTLIGLYAIKYGRKEVLQFVLDKFADVAALEMFATSSRMSAWKSIPRAILHNSYYYFCIFSLKEKRGDLLAYLVNYRMELRDASLGMPPVRIWAKAMFFAPEILHGADLMFDRLRRSFVSDTIVRRDIFNDLSDEEFLDFACQVNMLFCMKMAQELETTPETAPYWTYANYGRFYEPRVTPLMDRVEWNEDYKSLVLTVFGMTDFEEFTKKANEWLKWSAGHEKLGSGYMWDSVWGWKRPTRR